jgi:hypothetical protein
MAGLLEYRHQLVLIQRATKRRFAVFNLRAEIVPEFRNNVILLLARQPKSNGLQIAIKKFHKDVMPPAKFGRAKC